ncbi:MAG: hypothetical protein LBB60_09985 [Desulfovibrio sp.]|nr:hypothetical protein [Desulfovibrio sp.]
MNQPQRKYEFPREIIGPDFVIACLGMGSQPQSPPGRGFIRGILDSFTGESHNVRGIDCWRSSAGACRFGAQRGSQPEGG